MRRQKESFEDLQRERNIRAEQARREGDYEAMAEDAKRSGFVAGAKVRRSHEPDGDVGEVIGHNTRDRGMVIQVRFGEDEFPFTVDELELVKD